MSRRKERPERRKKRREKGVGEFLTPRSFLTDTTRRLPALIGHVPSCQARRWSRRRKLPIIHAFCKFWSHLLATFPATYGCRRAEHDHRRKACTSRFTFSPALTFSPAPTLLPCPVAGKAAVGATIFSRPPPIEHYSGRSMPTPAELQRPIDSPHHRQETQSKSRRFLQSPLSEI